MAQKSKRNAQAGTKAVAATKPRSAVVAANGIKTGHDFANLMSALMSDLIEGRIPPNIGNATCNAGGKLLKVVEMQIKYGTAGPGSQRVLTLSLQSPLAEPVVDPVAAKS